MYEDGDAREELMEYKINEGIKWISPRRFSERRKALYKDVISKPSKTIRSRKH